MNHGGAGAGPWIMADMENALWGADRVDSNEPSINHAFTTAMVKGDVSDGKNTPPAPYVQGQDCGGNDIAPCGFNGCVLDKRRRTSTAWPSATPPRGVMDTSLPRRRALVLLAPSAGPNRCAKGRPLEPAATRRACSVKATGQSRVAMPRKVPSRCTGTAPAPLATRR